MIVDINKENIKDVNNSNEPYTIFGKIVPEYKNNFWTFSEENISEPYEYVYPIDEQDYSTFINNDSKNIFLYYVENNCVGQIIIEKYWNKNSYIQDIGVKKDFRNMGIGHKLMDQAVKWTKEKNLNGIMLETKDVNLTACRFYKRYGFILGGVDTMLYSNFPKIKNQKALFWYYKV